MPNIYDFGMPFTSVSGDRLYSALDWREYFNALAVGGVVGDITNELEVLPQAMPNKSVYVSTGAILIKGAMRMLTATQTLTIADNTSGNPRIDRAVARLNLTNRKIEFVILQGTAAASPVAPMLTQNDTTWELSLARIAVANGFSSIAAAQITDERADTSACGYFSYRAKPAWYPEGQVPVDAWMYVAFKEQLTAAEITDIEANSSLMAIVNATKLHTIVSNAPKKEVARFTTSGTWTVPIGITEVDVWLVGGGGGGGGYGSGGGGGHCLMQKKIAVTPGATITATIGAGGTAGGDGAGGQPGGTGGTTSFGGYSAAGGNGGGGGSTGDGGDGGSGGAGHNGYPGNGGSSGYYGYEGTSSYGKCGKGDGLLKTVNMYNMELYASGGAKEASPVAGAANTGNGGEGGSTGVGTAGGSGICIIYSDN